MTKQEFLREYRVKGVPLMVQAHMGVLWDVAYEQGLRDGRDKGIREMICKEEDNLRKVYEAGITEANIRGSAAFRAAVCKVLHKMHGFGAMRCNRVVAAVAEELVGMLDPAETIRELREWGVEIEWEDPLEEMA